ncbi:sugar phosphate isomerase/epimerase family protein [Botrimarina hoheduenensis]|uniref:Fructoselysine 3-epimerase n=1 Tax=Botrimarina hoheduenensis TaxID=2528000 RepID=A0A5C5WFA2_9BACT|nr:sugar phosphate isomerase/epimerase [Botrimarina hoheduenensis]TWT48791.1 fructoselysine 3-epimerase [Botrimarina hoheduenensis]
MMQLAINQITTYRWTFEEDLHHYLRAGYQGVGLWLRKLEDFGFERGLELIHDSGIKVSSVSWVGGFTGGDALSGGENLAEARRTLDLAQACNAGSVVLHPGSRNRHTHRHVYRLLNGALESLLPHAEAAGTPLVLEPMHPACAGEWTFLTDLAATAQLVASYDSPWLRLAYDAYHAPLCRQTEMLLAEIAPLIGLVQVADYKSPHTIDGERCLLGEGAAPLDRLIATLDRVGYDGFIEVELRGAAIEPSIYHRAVDGSAMTLRGLLQGTAPRGTRRRSTMPVTLAGSSERLA